MNVVILGTGNLAYHLFNAFMDSIGISITQVVGRSANNTATFSSVTTVSTNYDKIHDADVYIVAVSDEAIAEVSAYVGQKNGLVVHTSGATDMQVIRAKNKGVFYPLQTFTKNRPIDFGNIPICVEADSPKSLKLLKQLASYISNDVNEINSQQRKKLHLAAVFANNFTNHLYGVAEDVCKAEGLPFDLLKPLIRETADKALEISPYLSQTGPAKRGDEKSMDEHLALLTEEDHKRLYNQLSESIRKVYEKEL